MVKMLVLLVALSLPLRLLGQPSAELQDLRREHGQVLQDIQGLNAAASKTGTAGTPAHQQAMLDLIMRMQKLQLAIHEAQNPSPKGAPPSMEQAAFDFLSATESIRKGELERGLNALEGLVVRPLSPGSLGPAMTLAGFYIDLLAEPKRSLALCERIQGYCRDEARAVPSEALQLRSYLQRLDKTRCRALALQGRLTACSEVADASMRRETAFVAEILKGQDARGKLDARALSLLATSFQTRGLQYASCGEVADGLGRSAEALGHWERARALLAELEGLLRRHGDAASPMTAMLVNNARLQRARALLALKRFDECLATFESWFDADAAYVKSQTGGRRGAYFVYALDMYARALLAAGRKEEALIAARRARDQFALPGGVSGPYEALAWKPAYWLGRIAEDMGKTAEARGHYLQAVEKLEALYARLRSGSLKGAMLSIEEGADAYRRLTRLLIGEGRTEDAWNMLERSRSTMLKDMLKSLPLRDRKSWPRELLEREGQIKKRLKELQPPTPDSDEQGRRGQAPEAAPEALEKARWDYELFLREIARQSSVVKAEPKPEPPAEASPDPVPSDRCIVSWFDDGSTMHAFTLYHGTVRHHPCGPSHAIANNLRRLRRHVAARSKRWTASARKLHQALIEPWMTSLGSVTEIRLVPSGELHGLPFACLLDSEKRSLVSVHALSRASALTSPQGGPPRPLPPGPCLILADPDGSLPHARTEARAVALAQPSEGKTLTLEGKEASETRLKAHLAFAPDQRVPARLRLATHGLLERSHGLFSSLTLAPDALEDGALTVAEIYTELDLRQTPLVILSACNSAMGQATGGDEVLGLSRAFQYAGAEWVLASLWEVDDAASAELMASFHERLGAPEAPAPPEALRQAMERLRLSAERWKHPYYWAAFALFRP